MVHQQAYKMARQMTALLAHFCRINYYTLHSRYTVGAPANFIKVERPTAGRVQAVHFNKSHDNYLYWIIVHDEPIRA